MRLVYKYNINNSEELTEMFKTSKELYNQALYEIRTNLKEDKFIFYNDLEKIMKSKPNLDNEINYKKLKAQVSQQILMLLDKNLKSYFKSIKDWKKHPDKYNGMPKLPNFKKKHNLLIFPNQASSIKEGYIHLSKTLKIFIPQWEKYQDDLKNFNQIRLLPKDNYVSIEIVYDKTIENIDLNHNSYSSIDFGINNLITLVSENSNPILFNGKQIKSINQFFNKRLSHLQSIKDLQKIKQNTKRIKNLYNDRENKMNDLFHKTSRYIVNFLIKNKIGNIVVGYNKGWKDSINIGRVNNQKFVQIPYLKLLNYLKYKCELVGIKLIETEESYTSKCDALNLEKIKKHETYSGKRIKRGLFKSSVGKLINADVNGAINILRKVVDNSYANEIINRGLLFNPVKIKNLYQMNLKFS